MPKRPFEAEVIRTYEPDIERMVKALRIVLMYQPEKELQLATDSAGSKNSTKIQQPSKAAKL